MKLFTGSAAASPSAQIVRPAMLSATDVEQVEVLVAALAVLDAVRPCATASPVPSRHGVHWPHDSS